MRILLDTNAYSALRRGHEFVAEQVRQAEEVLLSAVVAGELLYGFLYGSRYQANARDLQAFLREPKVRLVPVSLRTAEHFGRISTALRKRGRPIPTNDVWIAAHTEETGGLLISSDPHFNEIIGLSWLTYSAD
ncbi:MAG TPA: type II toxin-antitoxin system VapC family toxin [Thermoanaerobaculia bacterium]|nr:type II toxin-antitoxin system VapC family toxin [Thermoanaerobaculia bacterium]